MGADAREQQRRREAEQRRQQAKDAAQRQQQLQQEQVEQQKRRNQNRIEPDQMPSPPKKPEQTPQQQAEAHKGQQWHAYLGWVDEKLTAKQLVKEERKARREKERQRKKDGVTGIMEFYIFCEDVASIPCRFGLALSVSRTASAGAVAPLGRSAVRDSM